MGKKADIRALVPGCTAQEFWDAVYDDADVLKRYHGGLDKVCVLVTIFSRSRITLSPLDPAGT